MNEKEYAPYALLAFEVIHLATMDYEKGRIEDVRRFAQTEWFDIWSKTAGIDPCNARAKVMTGNLIRAKLVRGEVCLL